MMVDSGPHQAKFMGSQHQNHFCDLECKKDLEGSMHTTHTNKGQSRDKSHVSHEEIDHLKKSLRHEP